MSIMPIIAIKVFTPIMASMPIISIMSIMAVGLKSIMAHMSIMSIMAIMPIMSIMAVKSEARCMLSYGCRKNEFPGKRYNASNLFLIFIMQILYEPSQKKFNKKFNKKKS